MTWFQYLNNDLGTRSSTGSNSIIVSDNFWIDDSAFRIENSSTKIEAKKPKGMPAKIFFKLMKKKMGFLQNIKYKKRVEKIEKLAQKALDDGQEALGEKFLRRLIQLDKEAQLFSMGIKMFLSRDVFEIFEKKTERKKIQMTPLKNYTRPIPNDVMEAKNKTNTFFDDYMILHADGPGTVEETEKEKGEREKDPILFGICKDIPEKMFFIADWEDEYCDLTFDEIIDLVNPEDEEMVIPTTNKLKI